MFKTFIIILLIVILISLGQALFYMITDKGQSKRTVKMLTLRISLSLGLFILIMIAGQLGWIKPHGVLPPEMPAHLPTHQEEQPKEPMLNKPHAK
ncbi:MAG: twin transmembrane helix small protein [Gammaproteobacteria bacterium]|nr:twin transmembrane helix small protein [Gammaproteobacteria bacterium]